MNKKKSGSRRSFPGVDENYAASTYLWLVEAETS